MTTISQFIPTIALIGFSGSGKSTFVNSILSRKILETGVCTTTTSSTFIGSVYDEKFDCSHVKNIQLISNDNIEFNLIDLPGIANVLDECGKFDKIIQNTVVKADIVLWLTPSGTGFLTKYEEVVFLNILNILDKNTLETGMLHQIGILITKCNDFFKIKRLGQTIIESDETDFEKNKHILKSL